MDSLLQNSVLDLQNLTPLTFFHTDDSHYYDDIVTTPEKIFSLLNSSKNIDKEKSLKYLLAMLTRGIDIKLFLPSVIKALHFNTPINLKKLAYIIITHLSMDYTLEHEGQGAPAGSGGSPKDESKEINPGLLSVNTLQLDINRKEQGYHDVLYRSLALRTLISLTIKEMKMVKLHELHNLLRKDTNSYIRKGIAFGLIKLKQEIDKEAEEEDDEEDEDDEEEEEDSEEEDDEEEKILLKVQKKLIKSRRKMRQLMNADYEMPSSTTSGAFSYFPVPSSNPDHEEILSGIREMLLTLFQDSSIHVLGASLLAYEAICPHYYEVITLHFKKICHLLCDFDEWTQAVALEILTRYSRLSFFNPSFYSKRKLVKKKKGTQTPAKDAFTSKKTSTKPSKRENLKGFYSEEESDSSENDQEDELLDPVSPPGDSLLSFEEDNTTYEYAYTSSVVAGADPDDIPEDLLEADLLVLLRSSLPLLSSMNSAVVLSVIQLHFSCGTCNCYYLELFGASITKLINLSENESEYLILTSVKFLLIGILKDAGVFGVNEVKEEDLQEETKDKKGGLNWGFVDSKSPSTSSASREPLRSFVGNKFKDWEVKERRRKCERALSYMFLPYISDYFILATDPLYVRKVKLEILILITNYSYSRGSSSTSLLQLYDVVMSELQLYLRDANGQFVYDTIQAIGEIAAHGLDNDFLQELVNFPSVEEIPAELMSFFLLKLKMIEGCIDGLFNFYILNSSATSSVSANSTPSASSPSLAASSTSSALNHLNYKCLEVIKILTEKLFYFQYHPRLFHYFFNSLIGPNKDNLLRIQYKNPTEYQLDFASPQAPTYVPASSPVSEASRENFLTFSYESENNFSNLYCERILLILVKCIMKTSKEDEEDDEDEEDKVSPSKEQHSLSIEDSDSRALIVNLFSQYLVLFSQLRYSFLSFLAPQLISYIPHTILTSSFNHGAQPSSSYNLPNKVISSFSPTFSSYLLNYFLSLPLSFKVLPSFFGLLVKRKTKLLSNGLKMKNELLFFILKNYYLLYYYFNKSTFTQLNKIILFLLNYFRYDFDIKLRDLTRTFTILFGLLPDTTNESPDREKGLEANINLLYNMMSDYNFFASSVTNYTHFNSFYYYSLSKVNPDTSSASPVTMISSFNFNSLSAVVGHHAPDYKPIPSWRKTLSDFKRRASQPVAPPASAVTNASTTTPAAAKMPQNWYSDSSEEESEAQSEESEEESDEESDEDSEEDSEEESEEESSEEESSEEESDEESSDDSSEEYIPRPNVAIKTTLKQVSANAPSINLLSPALSSPHDIFSSSLLLPTTPPSQPSVTSSNSLNPNSSLLDFDILDNSNNLSSPPPISSSTASLISSHFPPADNVSSMVPMMSSVTLAEPTVANQSEIAILRAPMYGQEKFLLRPELSNGLSISILPDYSREARTRFESNTAEYDGRKFNNYLLVVKNMGENQIKNIFITFSNASCIFLPAPFACLYTTTGSSSSPNFKQNRLEDHLLSIATRNILEVKSIHPNTIIVLPVSINFSSFSISSLSNSFTSSSSASSSLPSTHQNIRQININIRSPYGSYPCTLPLVPYHYALLPLEAEENKEKIRSTLTMKKKLPYTSKFNSKKDIIARILEQFSFFIMKNESEKRSQNLSLSSNSQLLAATPAAAPVSSFSTSFTSSPLTSFPAFSSTVTCPPESCREVFLAGYLKNFVYTIKIYLLITFNDDDFSLEFSCDDHVLLSSLPSDLYKLFQ